jgi:hypothetical protein
MGRMTMHLPHALFDPIEMKVRPGWFVRVTLQGREPARLGGFRTEAEATEWIKRESSGWLKDYSERRYNAA